jgi:hypothetical protein
LSRPGRPNNISEILALRRGEPDRGSHAGIFAVAGCDTSPVQSTDWKKKKRKNTPEASKTMNPLRISVPLIYVMSMQMIIMQELN